MRQAALPRSGAGLLPRLFSGPLAVGRSGRRLTLAGLLTLEASQQVQRLPSGNVGAISFEARTRHLAWLAENMCSLHGIKVTSEGRPGEGPAVYVANHLGYIDPLAILSVVPCIPLAKEEIGDWPIIGGLLRDLGVLLVHRHDPYSGARVLRETMRALAAGSSVLAFPEGTTSLGDDVLPFRRGMFGVARLLDIPVVPIAVSYDSRHLCWVGDQTFLPHYVRATARPVTRARLVFGQPLPPRSEPTASALARRLREEMRRLLRQTH